MTVISIVAPFFNEQSNLTVFRQRVEAVGEVLGGDLELVLVDDHSDDGGPDVVREWALQDEKLHYIRLSRNSGAHTALRVGLRSCTGCCAVLMATDLQDPPELLPCLVDEWRKGFDVVWAARSRRVGDSWFTRFLSRAFCRLMRRVALPQMPPGGADFVLIDRKVIDACNQISERNVNLIATILWIGFKQTVVHYVKDARHLGISKWTFGKKLKLFIDTVVSFSYLPIRLMSFFGMCMAALGFAYAVVVVTGRVFGWVAAGTGYAALMTVLLVGQGVIMTLLGVLGEYLWRTLDEARGRPSSFIEDCVKHGEDATADSRHNRTWSDGMSGPRPSNLDLLASVEPRTPR